MEANEELRSIFKRHVHLILQVRLKWTNQSMNRVFGRICPFRFCHPIVYIARNADSTLAFARDMELKLLYMGAGSFGFKQDSDCQGPKIEKLEESVLRRIIPTFTFCGIFPFYIFYLFLRQLLYPGLLRAILMPVLLLCFTLLVKYLCTIFLKANMRMKNLR